MIYQLIQTICPIIAALLAGFLCRKTGVLRQSTVDQIGDLISKVLLPLVVLKAFYNIQMDGATAAVTLSASCCVLAGFLAGFPFRRLFGKNGSVVPFHTGTFEGGLLGYSLYAMVVGEQAISNFAVVDLGGCIVFSSAILMMAQMNAYGKSGLADCLDTVKKTPTTWAMVIGLILGLSGLGAMLAASWAGPVLEDTLELLTDPISALVLIYAGYNFRPNPAVNRLVFRLLGVRYLIQAVLAVITFTVLHLLKVLTPETTAALTCMFLLPPSYLFSAILGKEQETKNMMAIFISLGSIIAAIAFPVVYVLLLA